MAFTLSWLCLCWWFSISLVLSLGTEKLFKLSVVHLNDFHARFEETNPAGGACKAGEQCIGGFSRMYKQVMDILEENPQAILLNAGDNYQGTSYYNIGKWNITQQFLNYIPWDAMVLGNHEFDGKLQGLIPLLRAIKCPVICSNIDDSLQSSLKGLYNKSVVIERNGKKIGIIGVLFAETDTIAPTEDIKFFSESAAVNEEAERLVREEGVFTNIVLSHSGYYTDLFIAENSTGKISLIVGGHSHSFLWTGDSPPGPDQPIGPYPTIIQNKNRRTVLVVQASVFCKYLGNITVFYNEDGEVEEFAGAPIYLDHSKPQDENINKALEPWKKKVDAMGDAVIGHALTRLDRSNCRYGECTLGNLIADAFVHAYTELAEENTWTYASIALVNSGGVRTDIEIGNITYNDLITSQPFENTVDVGEIKGKYIKEMLEHNSVEHGRAYSKLKLWQYSGIQVKYDISRPRGQRLLSAKIRCQSCKVPIYEDLDVTKTYRLILPSFIVSVGDGFNMVKDNIKNLKVGEVDTEVIKRYLSKRSPIIMEQEGRITIYGTD